MSELRIHYGPGYRIYFEQRGDVVILLLCGGDKDTQERDVRLRKKSLLNGVTTMAEKFHEFDPAVMLDSEEGIEVFLLKR